jgi:hypothetical protein
MSATLLIVVGFVVWLTITTGLALFVNHGFFAYEGAFILAWLLLALFFWVGGVLRPGGSR